MRTKSVAERAMKALFLGAFAASQYERITARLESGLDTVLVADRSEAAAALAEAEIVVTEAWAAGMPPAPRLRLLQAPLTGTDAIEAAALPAGVTVCNAYGHEPAVAEYAIMAMLMWRLRIAEITAAFRAGSWSWSPIVGGQRHGELGGQTVGIVGLGHIGREIARRATALGCRVLAANRTPRDTPPGVERLYAFADLNRMLAESDIVVLSCALTEETQGLIDARRLKAMRPEAFLINVARGPVAEEEALYEALRDRRIGGAALDTWWNYPTAAEPERRPSRFPFHELPNVLMTPHCSPWTDATVERRAVDIARNLDRCARGETLANIVLQT
jgi:phosphoglycerate dehydrogenase-like enzyme